MARCIVHQHGVVEAVEKSAITVVCGRMKVQTMIFATNAFKEPSVQQPLRFTCPLSTIVVPAPPLSSRPPWSSMLSRPWPPPPRPRPPPCSGRGYLRHCSTLIYRLFGGVKPTLAHSIEPYTPSSNQQERNKPFILTLNNKPINVPRGAPSYSKRYDTFLFLLQEK